MSNIRGYSGFYKNNYLRSSYEYVYCKILEQQNLKYTVEEIIYDLGYCKYVPDFHIYNSNNILIEIVEVKSNNKNEIKKANNKIQILENIIDVPIYLYKYDDLKKLCIKYKLNINELISYWIKNSKGNPMNGDKNPMYGLKHSEKSKRLIGKKSSERCKNLNYRNKIMKGLIKFREAGGVSHRPQKTVERIIVKCIECNTKFEKMITSEQKYCSNKCKLIECTKLANNVTRKNNKILHNKIKLDILKWVDINQELFLSKKRNKIYFELKLILNSFNLKDIRNVKFIFTKSYNCNFNILHSCMMQEYKNYLKCMPNLHNDKV